ncbi:MAG: hypothetical protein U0T75_06755 [Chitinophagales bacterium]
MGRKKDIKKLKKRIKGIENGLADYQERTEKHLNEFESLLTEFNSKISDLLTLRKRSDNGVEHKKPVKKK